MRYEILLEQQGRPETGDWYGFDWPHAQEDARDAVRRHIHEKLFSDERPYHDVATVLEYEPGADGPSGSFYVYADKNRFVSTHAIHIDGRVIPVRKDEDSLYTREEWDNAVGADWTLTESGDVLFQGRVPVCESYQLVKRPEDDAK